MPKLDESRPFIPVRIAILTVSDTRTLADDKSGNTLSEMIREAGHIEADRAIAKDDVAQIRARVQAWIADPDIETSTIQSRACAGLAGGTYIFCLPGSPGACKDGWNGILKWQLDNRHRPCNFVEIMPRLEEHRRPKS
jgi:molybdenum cofactor biosynthesis protein B